MTAALNNNLQQSTFFTLYHVSPCLPLPNIFYIVSLQSPITYTKARDMNRIWHYDYIIIIETNIFDM